MIVLRNSSYSKKESTKLKDIPYGVRGLTTKSVLLPSIAELTGRRRGMEVADELDNQGKSDIEILDRSSEEAKKMGRVVGAATGLGVGIIGAYATNKILHNAVKNSKKVRERVEALQLVSASQQGTVGKLAGKLAKKGEDYLKDPKKNFKRVKNKGKIVGGALIGAGTLGGMFLGGHRAKKVTDVGNLDRIRERNKRNNSNK